MCVCDGGGGGGWGEVIVYFLGKGIFMIIMTDLWVDMGKFYLYLLGCCLEVPPSQNVSFYSLVL